ncbi:MAG: hypothetical protein ACXADO_10190 [Candidatus Thorarchaeota archaeon]|jgi:hypothetical protein
MHHVVNGGQYNGIRILSPETSELMHDLRSNHTEGYGDCPMIGYGMGWQLFAHSLEGHGGNTLGFILQMFCSKTGITPIGVILLVNGGMVLDFDLYWLEQYCLPNLDVLLHEAALLVEHSPYEAPNMGMQILLVEGVSVLLLVIVCLTSRRGLSSSLGTTRRLENKKRVVAKPAQRLKVEI